MVFLHLPGRKANATRVGTESKRRPAFLLGDARLYLPLQQGHLLREQLDHVLLSKHGGEQVAEGGT